MVIHTRLISGKRPMKHLHWMTIVRRIIRQIRAVSKNDDITNASNVQNAHDESRTVVLLKEVVGKADGALAAENLLP